jgi:hypothetical protein
LTPSNLQEKCLSPPLLQGPKITINPFQHLLSWWPFPNSQGQPTNLLTRVPISFSSLESSLQQAQESIICSPFFICHDHDHSTTHYSVPLRQQWCQCIQHFVFTDMNWFLFQSPILQKLTLNILTQNQTNRILSNYNIPHSPKGLFPYISPNQTNHHFVFQSILWILNHPLNLNQPSVSYKDKSNDRHGTNHPPNHENQNRFIIKFIEEVHKNMLWIDSVKIEANCHSLIQ